MRSFLKFLFLILIFVLLEIIFKIIISYKIAPFLYIPFIIFISLNYKATFGYTFSFFLGLLYGIEEPGMYLTGGILFLLISFFVYVLKFHMDYKNYITKLFLSFLFCFFSLLILGNIFLISFLRAFSTLIFSILFFYVAEKT